MGSLRWPVIAILTLLILPLSALAGHSGGLQQIDTSAIPIDMISRTSAGDLSGRSSESPSMSADGRYIAFQSWAALVPEDINDNLDIYVYDRETGGIEFAGVPNVDPDTPFSNRDPVISADGRFVAFQSDSSLFDANDLNDQADIFVYERASGTFSRVSITSGGGEPDNSSFHPALSGDGRFVAFDTAAALLPDDANGVGDVYIVDRIGGGIERIGGESGSTRAPSLSEDGRYVAFHSGASSLVLNDTNDSSDVFVLDRETGLIERVSVTSAGEQGDRASENPAISGDGRYVLFDSEATNLGLDASGLSHVYLHDRETGVTEQIDRSSSGASANAGASVAGAFGLRGPQSQIVSADGRFVVFSSGSTNLTENDVNGHTDVFLRDREAGITTLVSQSFAGASGDSSSWAGVLSDDGQQVAFISRATNLVYFSDDDQVQGFNSTDVFVRDLQAPYPSTPFEITHDRTDLPVATGQAQRTWTWAPEPFTAPKYEPYGVREDSNLLPFEQRLVQYYDKSRMEITNPGDDPNSVWYVTNGLLVVEMMTGELQVDDIERLQLDAAWVNVAGDAEDPDGPTYASLAGLRDAPPHPFDQPIIARVDREGNVTSDDTLAGFGVEIAIIDDVTGHAIATPFWEFMNSSGIVWDGNSYVQDQLFENPYFATGRPIIEAYWAEVLVGGQPREVLMQCFERRCLTYTPGNPDGFVVEAGNVGLHYYGWRYTVQPLAPDLSGAVIYTDGFHLNGADANGARVLYSAPSGFEIFSPEWSPDHTQIAFILRENNSRADLYIADSTGANVRQLTFGDNVHSPSWSPDGERLAFESGGMITIIGADGENRSEIRAGRSPVWSPVDDRIAFIERDGQADYLKIMDVDGGNVVDVITAPFDTRSGTAFFAGYAWSPDGAQFAYSATFSRVAIPTPTIGLFVVNADGTNDHAIETGGSEGTNPDWSPDGSQLTYSRQHVIYRMNLDGSEVRGLLWDFDQFVVDYDWIDFD